jgi:hypothetical protein
MAAGLSGPRLGTLPGASRPMPKSEGSEAREPVQGVCGFTGVDPIGRGIERHAWHHRTASDSAKHGRPCQPAAYRPSGTPPLLRSPAARAWGG